MFSLPVKTGWILASEVSLKVRHIQNTTYFIWIKKNKLEPAIIWKLVTCQRITSKRYSTSVGRHLSLRYGKVILVSGYPVLTAVNWSQHWCAIYVCNLWCGRTGGRCTVTWLPNFLGWVDLFTHGAPQARFARQSSATNWRWKSFLFSMSGVFFAEEGILKPNQWFIYSDWNYAG